MRPERKDSPLPATIATDVRRVWRNACVLYGIAGGADTTLRGWLRREHALARQSRKSFSARNVSDLRRGLARLAGATLPPRARRVVCGAEYNARVATRATVATKQLPRAPRAWRAALARNARRDSLRRRRPEKHDRNVRR